MEPSHLEHLLDDNAWSDVLYINTYAVFMGYLSMAIKGLGFLVLTWTTVVLLGGFVSVLQKEDFWCLTFITLVQTAGIFDAVMNQKLGYVGDAVYGLMQAVFWGVTDNPENLWASVAWVLVLVQAVLFAALLCPLAIIYLLGIVISGGISLWRLIEHVYSNSDSGGEASNLLPAMYTLYCLALLQAVFFCYRFILRRVGKKLAKKVTSNVRTTSELQVVYDYLRETRRGCEKDPSFAKLRNLITYAIDKIGSSSPVDSLDGVKILYTAICLLETVLEENPTQVIGQRMLMKYLVMSASSPRHILHKLLEMLNSRGLHDTETRHQAAKIVLCLALNINLEDFPQGIQHISSLIGTFQEYSIAEPYHQDFLYDHFDQDWKLKVTPGSPSPAGELGEDYKNLLLCGLYILQKLALNENNCRVMSDTRDLVSKIMAPVTSDLLQHTTNDHGAWYNVVKESMEVMSRLTTAPGETGAKLRRQISNSEKAIDTLWRIVNCHLCKDELQRRAIQILARLYMDTENSRSSVFAVLTRENSSFVRRLADIFTHSYNNYSSSIRGSAGGALSEIIFRGGISDATTVIQTSGDFFNSLTEVLLHGETETCRQAAAEIIEHLCTHYTENDEYLGKLKEAMTNAMPEVLEEIIRSGGETHTRDETDIENQHERVQAVAESTMSVTLLSSLLSLFGTVCDTMFISDLAPQLDATSYLSKLDASLFGRVDTSLFRFLNKVVVERKKPTVENLLLCKVTGKLVISMMEHNAGRFARQEDLARLIEALSTASTNMLDLDYSMVFSCGTTSSSRLHRCTLASLMKECVPRFHCHLPPRLVVPSTSEIVPLPSTSEIVEMPSTSLVVPLPPTSEIVPLPPTSSGG